MRVRSSGTQACENLKKVAGDEFTPSVKERLRRKNPVRGAQEGAEPEPR